MICASVLRLDEELSSVFSIDRLTWKGHDFVDATRDPKLWTKAKSTIGEKLVSAPFEIVTAVLTQLAKAQLGITGG